MTEPEYETEAARLGAYDAFWSGTNCNPFEPGTNEATEYEDAFRIEMQYQWEVHEG